MKRPNPHFRRMLTAPRLIRIGIGLLQILGGVFGFLPVLGFWMIPLGLLVIFFEVPWMRAQWRQVRTWWKGRRGPKEQP